MDYNGIIAKELSIQTQQVDQVVELLKGGATIPFIARYRKEKTGSLDEVKLQSISERVEYFDELDTRKSTVLKTIDGQKKLTPELKEKIEKVTEKVVLEDLYLPYKPKRQTKATVAKNAGLEPLADILQQQDKLLTDEVIAPYLSEEKEIKSNEDAIKGAKDILAERISENAEYKAYIRKREQDLALLVSVVTDAHKKKRSKYEMYYDYKEKQSVIPSHRILAIRRGEKEGILKTSLVFDDQYNIDFLKEKVIRGASVVKNEMSSMVEDAYKRLIRPSLESEMRLNLKKEADKAAIEVFSKNLKDVLLMSPAGNRIIMGVDPGFRSGTKLAIIDKTGKFVEQRTIYPLPPQKEEDASKTILLAMIERFEVEIIAIGNGTASREIDEFISSVIKELDPKPIKMIVSEAGASVYSASPIARQEFPELDVSLRGAISIARRVQDPLAELVKIDPKSIGVGQYQHDVNQRELKKKLELVVESCVNSVGVDVNTASEALLSYVSGINKSLSKAIVSNREKGGVYKSRASLVKVPHFGPKAFEQAAGFLRVLNAENPLDCTAVHPESYNIITEICENENIQLKEVIGKSEKIQLISFEKYASEEIGLPTLFDIKAELEKPGRDPRKKFAYANFNPDIKSISDLKENMWTEGVVTNVTDFGVFVDIGVHQDGLVHVSEFANRFISDIKNHITTGDIIKVRVIGVDVEQKRISLSMKKEGEMPKGTKNGKKGNRPQRPKKKKHATLNQLKNKFSDNKNKKQKPTKLAFSIKSIMKSGR